MILFRNGISYICVSKVLPKNTPHNGMPLKLERNKSSLLIYYVNVRKRDNHVMTTAQPRPISTKPILHLDQRFGEFLGLHFGDAVTSLIPKYVSFVNTSPALINSYLNFVNENLLAKRVKWVYRIKV